MTKVYFASDHAGYEMKNALTEYVRSLAIPEHISGRPSSESFRAYEVEDLGPFAYDPNDDYPITVEPLAESIANEPDARGIIIGGSGQGEAMVANRHEHVRAIEYYGENSDIVRIGREHNDANVLSLGARFVSLDEAKEAVKIFLETPFSEDPRHVRRIDEIDAN